MALVLKGLSPIPNVQHLEKEIIENFSTTLSDARAKVCHGVDVPSFVSSTRDNFNYILLDPRKLSSSEHLHILAQFKAFVESIFYIGKGKNSRPIQHLKDAKAALNNGSKVRTKILLYHSYLFLKTNQVNSKLIKCFMYISQKTY